MSNRAVLRLQKELLDVRKNLDKSSSIYVHYDENNIMNVRALICGPLSTPYAGGQFEFSLVFPKDYPTSAPKCTALTTDMGRTRFNPNIYAGGKVCLSILGTWHGQAGEQWSSAHGVSSVLLSIQSLMSDKPYHNEPGYETVRPNEASKVEEYNLKIRHETIRIAVCDRLENFLGLRRPTGSTTSVFKAVGAAVGSAIGLVSGSPTSASSEYEACDPPSADSPTSSAAGSSGPSSASSSANLLPPPGKEFEDLSKRLFLWYYDTYMQTIRTESPKVTPGQGFAKMSFEHARNSMDGCFVYPQLEERLMRIRKAIMDETEEWMLESRSWIMMDSTTCSNLRRQFEQIRESKDYEGLMELQLRDDNPFVWEVLVFGRPMTQFDGGLFKCRMVFHDNFPEVHPRVTFTTPVYHPHVTEDGVPFYRVVREDSVRAHLTAICDIFDKDPVPDPATHVNRKAAALYFGTKEERREYSRNARKCANRSVDY